MKAFGWDGGRGRGRDADAGLSVVALLAALLSSDAAIYINLAEHPARMECETLLATTYSVQVCSSPIFDPISTSRRITFISMVKPAKFCNFYDGAECQMRTRSVVVAEIGSQRPL